MKYFLSLIVLFLTAQLMGQPYLNETSRWKQYSSYGVYPPGIIFEEDIVIRLDGDTMIGDMVYKRVLKTGIGITYYTQDNDTIFHGPIHEYLDPIREADQIIYVFNRQQNKEVKLYDFNLVVGDTLKTGVCLRDSVISIDTLYLGDVPRRQFHLPSQFGGDISTLVEGVGSTFGFYWGVCNVITSPYIIRLQCFSQDGDFIQFDSTYDCNNWILADEMVKENIFSIHPNPFTDEIQIHFSDAILYTAAVTIVNMMGTVVFQSHFSSSNPVARINLPDLSPGMYVVSIRHPQGITSQKMMKL